MKWNFKTGGFIEDENGKVITYTPDYIEDHDRDLIWRAPEMYEAILTFVEEVDSGTHKPKKAYERFKQVLTNIKPETNATRA